MNPGLLSLPSTAPDASAPGGMSRRGPEELQAAYLDAAAYFPEEEWKLLQDWQIDLYRSVMKEIHQALISLGPLIATTVWSLRGKAQAEEPRAVNVQESEVKQTFTQPPDDIMGDSGVRFKINIEAPQEMNNLQDTDKQEREDGLRTEFPLLNGDACLRKEEQVSMLIDHLAAEIRKDSTNLIPEYKVFSFHIKDEEETGCMDPQNRRRVKRSQVPSDNESMNRKKKAKEQINCPDVSPPCEGSSWKRNTLGIQSSNKETNPGSQQWAECYPEIQGEKTAEHKHTFFGSQEPLNFHLEGLNVGRSDQYSDSELRDSQWPDDFQETQQNHRTYVCNENTSNHLNEEFTRPMERNSRERLYACTECEKSFFHRSHLITHLRIHSGEKPYFCGFCHKRFNRKDYLDEHIRIHTGERPYTCMTCQKSFIRKCHLNDHQRKVCTNPATQ
ncbi:uncharacterized protein LOC144780830 isoform X2 [Lissotriton helveticus]